jgi:carboxypeptidase A4
MKFLAPFLATLAVASAAAVNNKVTYDGWKVYRVTVGSDSAKLSSVMNKLQLSTWKGKVGIQGYNSLVMHKDLGASIAQEEIFETYACIYPRPTAISAMR